MAKFYDVIGYAETVETAPGVWEEVINERSYYGDVIRNIRRLEGGGVNDNVDVNNSISIVADAYALSHFFTIRYVRWMGALWKISAIEVQSPRLILSVGGLYHGS